MWLIVGQMPIKAGWQDSSLVLWELHPPLYNKYNPFLLLRFCNVGISEAVIQSCSLKKMRKIHRRLFWHRCFLWILRNLKEQIFSQNTTSCCFWYMHQSRFRILIMYVINCSWSVNIFSFFLRWRMVERMV